MKLVVMAVRDEKANVWNTPFFTKHGVEGVRSFHAAVKDTTTMLHKFPEDFALYMLGYFDDETGTFELGERPAVVAMGRDAVD